MIVDPEKVLREADGTVDGSARKPDSGGKHRSGVRLVTVPGEKPEDHKRYVKELDSFVSVMLLEETSAVLSLGTLCEDHWYTTTGPAVKSTSHQKRARTLIAICQTMCQS